MNRLVRGNIRATENRATKSRAKMVLAILRQNTFLSMEINMGGVPRRLFRARFRLVTITSEPTATLHIAPRVVIDI
jgi:hypothetical protein